MLFCPLHLFLGKLLSVVINNSFQLVLSSLESLYNLSGIGQATSHHIAEVHHSIGTVCLTQLHVMTDLGGSGLKWCQLATS